MVVFTLSNLIMMFFALACRAMLVKGSEWVCVLN